MECGCARLRDVGVLLAACQVKVGHIEILEDDFAPLRQCAVGARELERRPNGTLQLGEKSTLFASSDGECHCCHALIVIHDSSGENDMHPRPKRASTLQFGWRIVMQIEVVINGGLQRGNGDVATIL